MSEFDPTKELGHAIGWGAVHDAEGKFLREDPMPAPTIEGVVELLKEMAAKELPPGTRYEVRRQIPWNYGRTHGMAWYRMPEFDAHEDWPHDWPVKPDGEPGDHWGYRLMGQFTT